MISAEKLAAFFALEKACADTGDSIAEEMFGILFEQAERGVGEAHLTAMQDMAADAIIQKIKEHLQARFGWGDEAAGHFGIVAENAFFDRLEVLSAGLSSEVGHA